MTLANRPERDTSDHGGPEDLQDAWKILAFGAPIAARALIQVAEKGRVEAARVAAAKTLLEFTGFGTKEVPVMRLVPMEYDHAAPKSDSHVSPAEQIRLRMAQLAKPAFEAEDNNLDDLVSEGDEVVEAELVEDYTPGQE
jgi:hypothetical protein